MAHFITFPKLGANVIEGAVGVWRKREGDCVRAGEPLVEMITSKATFEIESPVDGVLCRILAPAKSNVPVGYILGIVGAQDEELPDPTAENEQLVAALRAGALEGDPSSYSPMPEKIRATPGARRLAKELGVELAEIRLTSAQEVITESDVRRVAGK